MYGGQDEVQLWCGTQHPDTHAQERANQLRDGGQHHGPRTDDERATLRHVPVTREPHGGSGNGCGFGCVDAHALHPRHAGTLGAWVANCAVVQHACLEQYIDIELPVGRRDHLH